MCAYLLVNIRELEVEMSLSTKIMQDGLLVVLKAVLFRGYVVVNPLFCMLAGIESCLNSTH
jgi:hypothetical protein